MAGGEKATPGQAREAAKAVRAAVVPRGLAVPMTETTLEPTQDTSVVATA